MKNQFYILNDNAKAGVKLTSDDIIGYVMLDAILGDGQVAVFGGHVGYIYKAASIDALISEDVAKIDCKGVLVSDEWFAQVD